MPATLHQFSQTQAPVGATTIAIGSALVASDLLVAVHTIGVGGGRSVATSGFGTWQRRPEVVSNASFNMLFDTLTGVTGTGNVTVTVVGTGVQTTLYVIRGLVSPSISVLGPYTGQPGNGTVNPVGLATYPAPAQAVLAVAAANGTTIGTFLDAASTPSVGAWTVDGTAAGAIFTHGAAHVFGGDGVTSYLAAQSRAVGGIYFVSHVSLVLGEPAANALVATGEYAEALTEVTANLTIEGSYAETLTEVTADLRLEGGYVEVLTDALLESVGAFVGWGIPRV